MASNTIAPTLALPAEPTRAETVELGGLPIAVLDRAQCADSLIRAARRPRGYTGPLFMTSANGEVIARAASDPLFAKLMAEADQIVADGQPMVIASRAFCRRPLPERVATTDLFHDVAVRAVETGTTFYLLGASPDENAKAAANVRRLYPGLKLLGNCHGYLRGPDLDAKLAEIDALKPDILWLALGVPAEQAFVHAHRDKLTHVGLVKTSGGLFNFLSGSKRRAPLWMQKIGLEWAFRMAQEPGRLFWRYAVTNPQAIYLLVTRSA